MSLRRAVVLAVVLLGACALADVQPDDDNSDFVQRAVQTAVTPKTHEVHNSNPYVPARKDWATAIGAFKVLFAYEKRYASLLIRGAFHDCFAIDITQCRGLKRSAPNCRGCDGSLLLSAEEMARPENNVKKWSARISRACRLIAQHFDLSLADTLQLGAAVAVEHLSFGRVRILGSGLMRMGRLDTLDTAPDGQLPGATISSETFASFWNVREFSIREGAALLGSHSLVDNNNCWRGFRQHDQCDPFLESCSDIRMLRWESHYYHDICTPDIRISRTFPRPLWPLKPVRQMNATEYEDFKKQEMCTFTSPDAKSVISANLDLVRAGTVNLDNDAAVDFRVTWSQDNCTRGRTYGVRRSVCPHPDRWPYTVNDAFNGQVCATMDPNQQPALSNNARALRSALRSFLNQVVWDEAYVKAHVKMSEAWMDMVNAFTLPAGIAPKPLTEAAHAGLRNALISLERRSTS